MGYIPLQDLEVYQISRELSRNGWDVYSSMDWQTKKIMGDQFITALDSTGANIAEGYARFHYLDRIKFYYNARASLVEAIEHWLELIRERGKVDESNYEKLKEKYNALALKLNNFIRATYRSKETNEKKK